MTDDSAVLKLVQCGNAPANLRARRLGLDNWPHPLALPAGLRCHALSLKGTKIRELPADLRVEFKLDLSDCQELSALPRGLRVPVLVLRGCRRLAALPEDLQVDYLDVQDCTALSEWPESAQVSIGAVNARNCSALRALPARLGPITSLDLAGCRGVTALGSGVRVRSWIDLAGTGLTSLPGPLAGVALRWRGVAIDARIAFFPETLKAAEVLAEPNAEVRRVMIERVGFQRLLSEAGAQKIHEDRDAGGPRQLLRLQIEGDEDLLCVSVHCPSTGRHYVIRVPPTMKTCHQAVAWTAGFDNANDYRPIAET